MAYGGNPIQLLGVTAVEAMAMKLTGILSTLKLTGSAHSFRRYRTPMRSSVELLEGRCLLAAGELDPSFGNLGVVNSTFGFATSLSSSGFDAFIQPDGRILVAGTLSPINVQQTSSTAIARYNNDGSLDTTFGNSGLIGVAVPSADQIVVQADGKILVAGSGKLARCNTDGTLDVDFGSNGIVNLPFTGDVLGVNERPDRRLVILIGGSQVHVFVVHLNPDGTPDRTQFAIGAGDITFGRSVTMRQVAWQNDGRAVVVGSAGDSAWVCRLTTDGFIDNSFGFAGQVLIDFAESGQGRGDAVSIARDGKILIGGSVLFGDSGSYNGSLFNTNFFEDFAIARLTTNGRLDVTFGNGGVVFTDLGRGEFVGSIASQFDGKIIVTGTTFTNSPAFSSRVTARYTASGLLDSTFGNDGIVLSPTNTFVTPRVLLQRDSRILLMGAKNFGFVLTRLHNDIGVPATSVQLPPTKGRKFASVVGDSLIVRSRNNSYLIDPVLVGDLDRIDFVGTPIADDLQLDSSMSQFQGTIRFFGGEGNDLLTAKSVGLGVVFDGGSGNDTFLGGSGQDSAFGGSGNDSLVGAGGDDFLDGGADKDQLKGDAGNDLLFGNSGNDSLRGGTGHDTLLGDTGRDTLQGEDGDDVLDGGDDEDFIVGSAGNDSMRGGNGKDTLYGGAGADLLIGSSGNDYLFGDSGDDSLVGDNGDDQIFGGTGLDLINPGIGRDGIHDSRRVIDLSFTFDFDALIVGLA